jgi:CspA family cold shock protein
MTSQVKVSYGKVKFFNTTKGYGFITESETGNEYFCHTTRCYDTIKKDQEVCFNTETTKKGVQAVNVRLITAQHTI